jgi:hypothetical protein
MVPRVQGLKRGIGMAGKNRVRGIARYWPRFLLVIPFLLVVWVPSYNRVEPTLGGVPFFYWYQLGAILIGAGVALTVYWLELWVTRTTERAAAELDSSGTPGDIF